LANTIGICVYCVYKNLVKIDKCEAYAIDSTAMITPIIFCRDTLRYLAFLCPFTNGFQKYGVNEIQTTMMLQQPQERQPPRLQRRRRRPVHLGVVLPAR
jgi:hypothetical protein